MRVVSWNVNGIRACVRHGFVIFVGRSAADIVGVQEVRAQPEDIPPAARRPPGWHTAFTVAERRGPVLVIGDYNTAHRAIDLARPQANVTHSGFLPEERAELDRWIDTRPLSGPTNGVPTIAQSVSISTCSRDVGSKQNIA